MNEPAADQAVRVPVAVCLGLNLAVFTAIAFCNPLYLTDFRRADNPDALHYVHIGRNVFLNGAYSRNEEAPFHPDMLRTPIYPLFAGGLDLLGTSAALYLVQVLLHAGSCVLLYLLVRSCWSARPAFWASLFLATDLSLVATNFTPMSEPLFLFLTLAACTCLLPVNFSPRRAVAGSVLLGLAILTRPAALYLPPLLAVIYLFGGKSRAQLGRIVCQIALWALPALLLTSAWIARNALVCGLAKLTTVDTSNLVYFVGAGAYQVKFGIDLEPAQKKIQEEFDVLSYREAQNDHTSDRSPAEIEAELAPVVRPVLSKYPRALLQASILSILKANISHATGDLAFLLSIRWEGVKLLGSNPAVLIAALVWQLLHVGVTLLLSVVGLVRAFRTPSLRAGGAILFILLGYFMLLVMMFGYEAFYRCRLPAVPFLFAFAGLGLCRPVAPPAPLSAASGDRGWG